MTNEQLLEKMSKDMQMRNFSKYTYYAYMHKGKEIIKYFNKPMEEVGVRIDIWTHFMRGCIIDYVH